MKQGVQGVLRTIFEQVDDLSFRAPSIFSFFFSFFFSIFNSQFFSPVSSDTRGLT
jgi:hypothetical protein